MKLLIINADDTGFSDEINDAVKKCFLAGAITGTSIMATGERFLEAAQMLRDIKKTEVGAHLTLTHEPARLWRTVQGSAGGRFAKDYRALMLSFALGGFARRAAYRELATQIRKIKEEGLDITHIDGHEHVHMFPWILDITVSLAREFGIPYIRIPYERVCVMRRSFSVKDLLRFSALRMFTAYSGNVVRREGFKHNDFFLGHFHALRVDDDILCYMIDALQDGITELCVHPGHKNSPNELDALLTGRWKALAAGKSVRLVTHREACR